MQEYISFGIAHLSSYLQREGHEVELVDYTWGGTTEDGVKKIFAVRPDIICFSVLSPNMNFSLKIAHEIKKKSHVPICFGGPHPTVAPGETIRHNAEAKLTSWPEHTYQPDRYSSY